MRTVVLHGEKAAGRVALVDDGDYELVMQYRWNVLEIRRPGKRPGSVLIHGPYAAANVSVKKGLPAARMHKLITGWPITDHIDHNGLNNCRYNLREATHTQNVRNARPQNGRSSGYKGVSWFKAGGKWRADIRVNGKLIYLGLFTDEIKAAQEYDAAALKHFGEFANPNFPTAADVPIGQLGWDFGLSA